MAAITKRTATSPLTELFDWIESGWPGVAELRREGAHMMRIEDRMDEGRYVIRAELPGIDPEKDVEISVADGVLTICAERREEVTEKGRSEFHYGSFVRRVSLPTGSREDELSAHYNDGILEVDVPLEESKPATRMIPVARGPSE
jgi:HSP20 family molecular chaperone IbpA